MCNMSTPQNKMDFLVTLTGRITVGLVVIVLLAVLDKLTDYLDRWLVERSS